MIIDAHQHVFWHGRDDAGLVADLDAHGVDVAWLLSWEVPPDEDEPAYRGAMNPVHVRPDGTHPGIPLSDLIIARDRYPGRFVLGYCPSPSLPDAPRLFEAAVRMHGVRVCGEWKFRMLLDDPRCLELFRAAGSLGCPVVFHLDVPYLTDPRSRKPVYQRAWYGGTVENLQRVLEACPGTTFIGHAPGFWREISGDAADDPSPYPTGRVAPGGKLHGLLDRYPNLWADLSAGSALGALRRDPEHAREFIQRFSDRLLFGRDDYGSALIEFLRSLDLPDAVQRSIFADNALRLVPSPGDRSPGEEPRP
jgi:predicted TIM-barrel fold metal-dependent hydrolase